MIEFTVTVPSIHVYLNHEGYTDVVYEGKYTIKGSKNGYSFAAQESFLIDISDLSNFIQYDQLTQSIVASWIEAQHQEKIAEMKQHIENYIDEVILPVREERTLPE
jgi:hypothetical protein